MRRGRAVGPAAIAALAVALCSGCGPEPSFVTRHGVQVFLEKEGALSQEQAEQMEDYLLAGIAPLGYAKDRSLRCLAHAEVRVLPAIFTCADGRRRCAGEQWDQLLLVAAMECPFSSAYVHELAHWLQQCVRGAYDPDHTEAGLWELVGNSPLRCEP